MSTATPLDTGPQRYLEQYRTLLEVSQSIQLHKQIPDLIEHLGVLLHKVVKFDFISLFVFDEPRRCSRLLMLETPIPNDIPRGYEQPFEGTISGEIFRTQKPLMIPDIDNETRFKESTAILRKYEMVSACYVPLTSAVRKVGVLGFGVRQTSAYRPNDIEFLEQIGRQIASAVDNALHREQLVKYQHALQAERDHLKLMLDISNALVSKPKLNELFSAIAVSLHELLHQEYSSLSLFDQETGQLRLHSLYFPTGKGIVHEGMEISLEESWSGRAFVERRPVRLHGADIEAFHSKAAQNVVAEGLRSGCSVPLIVRERILGTLAVASTREDGFTENEERLLIEVAKQVALAVENALAFQQIEELKNRLAEEKLYLEDEIRHDRNFEEIIGDSASLREVLQHVRTVAGTGSSVLILGETGTGKELIARAIHNLSSRQGRTFVKLNCSAIPTGLLESELFGHERGAFTGAIARRIGRFELADHGTLFLDEVGDIPLELQPKLLRVLQEGEFERLGSTRTIRCDVRLVAATNRNLKRMVDEREYRSDLYYRLNVFPIYVPPLRERREDIPLLVRYFAQKFAIRMNRQVETVPADAMNACVDYAWPGNVRELQNFVERGVILTRGTTLHLPIAELPPAPSEQRTVDSVRPTTLESAERDLIIKTLNETGWLIGGPSGAASVLGMKRTTLQSKMKKLGIRRELPPDEL